MCEESDVAEWAAAMSDQAGIESQTKSGVNDFLSESEVDSLLRGVTGEDDTGPPAADRIPFMIEFANCRIAYWNGVKDALTNRIKYNGGN